MHKRQLTSTTGRVSKVRKHGCERDEAKASSHGADLAGVLAAPGALAAPAGRRWSLLLGTTCPCRFVGDGPGLLVDAPNGVAASESDGDDGELAAALVINRRVEDEARRVVRAVEGRRDCEFLALLAARGAVDAERVPRADVPRRLVHDPRVQGLAQFPAHATGVRGAARCVAVARLEAVAAAVPGTVEGRLGADAGGVERGEQEVRHGDLLAVALVAAVLDAHVLAADQGQGQVAGVVGESTSREADAMALA